MHLGEFDAEHAAEQFELIVPIPWQEDYKKGISDCKDKGNKIIYLEFFF